MHFKLLLYTFSVIFHQSIYCQASAHCILEERSESDPVKSFARDLKQVSTAPAPKPAEAPTLPGGLFKPDKSIVYQISNQNYNLYRPYACLDACAHGLTCVWQNVWLWQCGGTNPSHQNWVWDPDTLIIRSAAIDSFIQYPEICMEACTDFNPGNGACALTESSNVLNVGYSQCTGGTNQQFTLNGSLIVSKSNNQCLTAGAQDCGKFAYCDKSQAQTKKDNSILNVFLQQCDGSNINQQWRLARPENATLPNFTPLSESASVYPPPEADLAASIQKTSPQVLSFVEADSGQCLSIEDHTNCQSKQNANGTMDASFQDYPVCSWNNAYLQTCWNNENAKADQGWVYDSQRKLIALASSIEDNVCLEMCNTTTFARGPCSLDNKNLITQNCHGGPAQQFDFLNGKLYNKFTDLCITAQNYCFVNFTAAIDPSLANSVVGGYNISKCTTNIKNGPWATMPWQPSSSYQLGITNLVGGACESASTFTTKSVKSSSLQPVTG